MIVTQSRAIEINRVQLSSIEFNRVQSSAIQRNHVQLVEKATHDEGNLLDHIYISSPNILSKDNAYLKSLYFSDHDALCIRIPLEM